MGIATKRGDRPGDALAQHARFGWAGIKGKIGNDRSNTDIGHSNIQTAVVQRKSKGLREGLFAQPLLTSGLAASLKTKRLNCELVFTLLNALYLRANPHFQSS